MKTNFGTQLSRNEMKEVIGGKGSLICTCGNSMETTVCGFSTLKGSLNCGLAASSYCSSIGYSTINCDALYQ